MIDQVKKTVIFGCGQGGITMLSLLNENEHLVIAFSDNQEKYHGITFQGIPVVSPMELKVLEADDIFISILNEDACRSIKKQLEDLGITATFHTITPLKKQFDLRLASFKLIAKEIKRNAIKGSVAELGVYQGDFAAHINKMFPDRNLFLFDTFQGFDERDIIVEENQQLSYAKTGKFSDTSVELVLSKLSYPEKARIKKGYFPQTCEGLSEERFAFVSLDADLYQPIYEGLTFFYPKMNRGGVILIHDYNNTQFLGVGEAVRKYGKENQVYWVPLCDFHGSCIIVKP